MARVVEHVCVVCAALAVPPPRPRPAPFGGPRSRHCTTHWREREKARKARDHAGRVRARYGVTAEEQVELWAFQGCTCPCGRRPTRFPDTDHDHVLARSHGHDPSKGCRLCTRGMTCRACNLYVLARYTSRQLRALADYLDAPPWPRLRREMDGSLPRGVDSDPTLG